VLFKTFSSVLLVYKTFFGFADQIRALLSCILAPLEPAKASEEPKRNDSLSGKGCRNLFASLSIFFHEKREIIFFHPFHKLFMQNQNYRLFFVVHY
jgi:hypothetical protein